MSMQTNPSGQPQASTQPVRTGSQAQVIADILEHGAGTYIVDESVEYESEEDVFVGVQRIQGLEPEIQMADEKPVYLGEGELCEESHTLVISDDGSSKLLRDFYDCCSDIERPTEGQGGLVCQCPDHDCPTILYGYNMGDDLCTSCRNGDHSTNQPAANAL